MTSILIFVLISCICNIYVQGFLLEDRTPPPTTGGPAIAYYHYTALVNMLMGEREDRLKLQKQVSYLQKELVATQTGVTDLYHERRNENATLNKNMKLMDGKYNNLQKKYDSLKADFDSLAQNCGDNGNKTNRLEKEIASLKQLKAIGDLQTVMNIQTETKHLEHELQLTNSKLNSVTSEANARKQDFMALFTKADTTEKQLNSSVKELQQSANISVSKLENYVDAKVSALESNQRDQLSKLGTSQNLTKRSIEQEIHDLQQELRTQPNRVAVTASALQKTYSSGAKIMFPNVYTIHGITSSSVTSLGTTGEFTCTRQGLYLISVFITTPTHSSYASVYKNNNVIAYIYLSLNGYHQTSSVTVLEHLVVNDKIYVRAYSNMYVYNNQYSCISILQITE